VPVIFSRVGSHVAAGGTERGNDAARRARRPARLVRQLQKFAVADAISAHGQAVSL
jgi:hypothetical protein